MSHLEDLGFYHMNLRFGWQRFVRSLMMISAGNGARR
jgi:hypothetical protein